MRLSKLLIEDLKRHEGFRARPYLCSAGRVTIGYGHNLEAHPESILLFPEIGEEISDSYQEAQQAMREVKAGSLRGRAMLERLLELGIEWNESEAEWRLEQDIMGLESSMTMRCAAYRHLVNESAAAEAGRTLSAKAKDGAGVRADVLMNMTYNLGIQGVLKFRKMQQAVLTDDYDTAAAEMLNSRWAAQVKGRAVELARRMRLGEREVVEIAKKKQAKKTISCRGMSMDSASMSKQEKSRAMTAGSSNSNALLSKFQPGRYEKKTYNPLYSGMFGPNTGGNMGGAPNMVVEHRGMP